MEFSPTIGEIAKALAEFKAQLKGIKKDARNPHYNSEYTTLDAIIDGTQSGLAAAGLTLVQSPFSYEETAGVDGLLVHTSGEWMRFRTELPMGNKKTPQGAGSAITYARRYQAAAIFGIASETDDDGNASSAPAAGGQPQRQQQRNTAPQPQPQPQRPAPQPSKPAATLEEELASETLPGGLPTDPSTNLLEWQQEAFGINLHQARGRFHKLECGLIREFDERVRRLAEYDALRKQGVDSDEAAKKVLAAVFGK